MKIKINKYFFGRMTIAEKKFTSDLIIYADGRIQDNWKRNKGHRLFPDDIAMLIDAAPKKLIIGTGSFGLMKVSESLIDFCKKRGIEVEACRTAEAVKRFNEAAKSGKAVAACFHLTC
jgi:hypothetical protein